MQRLKHVVGHAVARKCVALQITHKLLWKITELHQQRAISSALRGRRRRWRRDRRGSSPLTIACNPWRALTTTCGAKLPPLPCALWATGLTPSQRWRRGRAPRRVGAWSRRR
eukprot:6835227-Alexandrium_andersonii.AAC.1